MRSVPLRLEMLEDRRTPASFGNAWPEPNALTLSLAPDGTAVGIKGGALFAHLNKTMSSAVWRREAMLAFQTWVEHADLDISLTSDNGKPFGGLAGVQGKGWYGDFRLGAANFDNANLAVGNPFDLGDDWSGDVLLNTDYKFAKGNVAGHHDLFTVLAQEAGHALGLPNRTEAASLMFTTYSAAKSGPTAGDIAALRAIYGPRLPDAFDALRSNQTSASASALRFVYDADQLGGTDGTSGATPFVADAELTTRADVDFYRVTLPSDLNDFSVFFRTSGVSMLNARVTVYDSSMRVLATRTATDPANGDLSLFVSRSAKGGTFFVSVQAAADNPFGVGSYKLAVGKEAHEAVHPVSSGFVNDDRGGSAAAVVQMVPRTAGLVPTFEATHRASISTPTDYDTYRVVAPASGSMVVVVSALQMEKLDPRVLVFASDPTKPLAVETITDEAGYVVIQLRGVTAGATYHVRVQAQDPAGSYKEGDYFVGVDFRREAFALPELASGALAAAAPERFLTVRPDRAGEQRLSLTVPAGPADVAVRLTVYDARGKALATAVANAGAAAFLTLWLDAAEYTLHVVGGTKSGAALPVTAFALGATIRTDPIGVVAVKPTYSAPTYSDPVRTTTLEPVLYLPPDTSGGYAYVYTGTSASWLKPTYLYGDPWFGW